MISDDYKRMNHHLHRKATYGASGGRWAWRVAELKESCGARSVLDYGAGKGTLGKRVQFPVREYDPCVPGKDRLPDAADIVVCTDVLEHVEPEYLDSVLRHIASLTNKVAFLVVATRPAKKHLPDGRNAHLIVASGPWWFGELTRYYRSVLYENEDDGEAVFLCSEGVK